MKGTGKIAARCFFDRTAGIIPQCPLYYCWHHGRWTKYLKAWRGPWTVDHGPWTMDRGPLDHGPAENTKKPSLPVLHPLPVSSIWVACLDDQWAPPGAMQQTGRPMIRFLGRCPRTSRTTARTCIRPVRTPVSNGLLGAFLPIKRLHQHEARANLEENRTKGPLIDSRGQGLLQRTQVTCHVPQLRGTVGLRGVLAEPWVLYHTCKRF